jgi:hypothetical protein
MGFRKSADGIEKKGKTDTKVYPNDGKHIVDKGPKKNVSTLNRDMKAMGRNLARAKNQMKSGRGR